VGAAQQGVKGAGDKGALNVDKGTLNLDRGAMNLDRISSQGEGSLRSVTGAGEGEGAGDGSRAQGSEQGGKKTRVQLHRKLASFR